MNEQAPVTRASAHKPEVLIIVSVIAAIACLILASAGQYLAFFLAYYRIFQSTIFTSILSKTIVETTQWFLCGLLFPVCLILLCRNTKKSLYGKIFLLISLLVLAVQLLSAVFYAIISLISRPDSSLYDMIYTLLLAIPGSSLLSSAIALCRNIFNGISISRSLVLIFSQISSGVSNLFYILHTAICAIGFIKLSFSKK